MFLYLLSYLSCGAARRSSLERRLASTPPQSHEPNRPFKILLKHDPNDLYGIKDMINESAK
jgi:hypothetical protein